MSKCKSCYGSGQRKCAIYPDQTWPCENCMTLENLLKNQTNAVYIPEINDAWIDSEGQEQPPMPEQGCIEFGTPQDAVNFHDTWRKHFSLSMIENTIYIKPKATE